MTCKILEGLFELRIKAFVLKNDPFLDYFSKFILAKQLDMPNEPSELTT